LEDWLELLNLLGIWRTWDFEFIKIIFKKLEFFKLSKKSLDFKNIFPFYSSNSNNTVQQYCQPECCFQLLLSIFSSAQSASSSSYCICHSMIYTLKRVWLHTMSMLSYFMCITCTLKLIAFTLIFFMTWISVCVCVCVWW
jgi:hypothetical protein